MMRERFDRIDIIDLRGDVRRGERAGLSPDQGVFNIQVGTAITIAVADGSRHADSLAEIRYSDSWTAGKFSRTEKLNWLSGDPDLNNWPNFININRSLLSDFRPMPFLNGEMIPLDGVFRFHKSGVKTGNDKSFVHVLREKLEKSVSTNFSKHKLHTYNSKYEKYYAYRPFDRRWFYNDLVALDRPGPEFQLAWGNDNVCLYAIPAGTALGPAVWCHGLLPDYHAFRGSYGGYAFPLYDHRSGRGPYNINPEIVVALGTAYGTPVSPDAVFDAILCLLSAQSYTTQFAEDLEDVFPHIPFPTRVEVFGEAARIGAEIRAVETFARLPDERFLRGLARAETAPTGPLAPIKYADGEIRLCADGSGRISHIPAAVWAFEVSGYRVLPRWLAARDGLAIGPSFIPELRDVAARIAELIDLFEAADTILVRTLDDSLTRAALGLVDEEANASDV